MSFSGHTCSPWNTIEGLASRNNCLACKAQADVQCTCPDYWFPPDRREQMKKLPHGYGRMLAHHVSCAKAKT